MCKLLMELPSAWGHKAKAPGLGIFAGNELHLQADARQAHKLARRQEKTGELTFSSQRVPMRSSGAAYANVPQGARPVVMWLASMMRAKPTSPA